MQPQRSARLAAIQWRHRLLSMALLAVSLAVSTNIFEKDRLLEQRILVGTVGPYLLIVLALAAGFVFLLRRGRA